jgi:hypothetical protein
MPLSPSVIQTLDGIVAGTDHVVGYSEEEQPELRDGQATGRTGIRIYVDELDPGASLPADVEGMPVVDVVEIGHVEKYFADTQVDVGVDPRIRTRPLIGGISVSDLLPTGMTGTLGYFVTRQSELCLITSEHILETVGDTVIQPGLADHGTDPADRVGKVVASIDDGDLGVDCAAAKLDGGVAHTLTINGIGKVNGQTIPAKGDAVRKSGRTTGLTTGTVADPNVTIVVGPVSYRHQIVVHGDSGAFADHGDSGSVVVTTAGTKAIGLLMAGSPSRTIVNPIAAVLSALGATLA